MAIKKAVNQNYLTGESKAIKPVNPANKVFIDNFVSANYERLRRLFAKQANVINSSANDAEDILNDTLLIVYTDQNAVFKTQEEADAYLEGKFTPKEFRLNHGLKNRQ